jgi:hypothetical protein
MHVSRDSRSPRSARLTFDSNAAAGLEAQCSVIQTALLSIR